MIRIPHILPLFGLTCVLAACGGEPAQDSSDMAAPAAQATPSQAPESASPVEAPRGLSTLATAGQRVYLRCRSCHTIEASGPNGVGPNLHGIMDQEAAANPDFAYSDALKSAGLVWDEATLSSFLESRSQVVPGTRMAFAGLNATEDRDAVIAYLAETSE